MEEAGGSIERGDAFGRDWTKGGILRNLWGLSWPAIVTHGLYMVGSTFDMIWVGKLGAASIAGMGVAFIVITLVMMAKMGLIVGVRAMVARFVGAGDIRSASHVARQGFVISLAYGVVTTLIGVFFAESILTVFGLEADVVAEGSAYLRIMLAGWVTMSFWLMSFSIMQASGDTVTPMKISLLIRVFHLSLCPALVFGWWVFPPMGISGAALANVIYQSLGMIVALWVLVTGRSRLKLTFQNFRVDPHIIWRIVKIGIPACIMGAQRSIGNIILAWFMVPFGTVAVAAHSLVQRVEMILFLPSMGLGTAAGVLVGQNLGAQHPERAERSGWLATGLVQGFLMVCSLLIVLWPESMVQIFNTEPGLVKLTGTFLRIAAAGYLVTGFTAVLQNCISGAGDTLPPMLISVAVVWILQLPLAFLLPRFTNLGVYGVRWSIVAGVVLGSAGYALYFQTGRWKRIKV